jgi:hypothetical protein
MAASPSRKRPVSRTRSTHGYIITCHAWCIAVHTAHLRDIMMYSMCTHGALMYTSACDALRVRYFTAAATAAAAALLAAAAVRQSRRMRCRIVLHCSGIMRQISVSTDDEQNRGLRTSDAFACSHTNDAHDCRRRALLTHCETPCN